MKCHRQIKLISLTIIRNESKKTKTKKKTSSKKKGSDKHTSAVAEQLEHAFLAGLGAMANTQKVGSKAFDALIEQETARRLAAL